MRKFAMTPLKEMTAVVMMFIFVATFVVFAARTGHDGDSNPLLPPHPRVVVRLSPLEWRQMRNEMEKTGSFLVDASSTIVFDKGVGVYVSVTNRVPSYWPQGGGAAPRPSKDEEPGDYDK
jgi:hypothetical protein